MLQMYRNMFLMKQSSEFVNRNLTRQNFEPIRKSMINLMNQNAMNLVEVKSSTIMGAGKGVFCGDRKIFKNEVVLFYGGNFRHTSVSTK